MRHQLDTLAGWELPGGCSSVGRGIVMMKGDAGLWTSGTYSMQHLGEALMHIPICGHSAPFLQWNVCADIPIPSMS